MGVLNERMKITDNTALRSALQCSKRSLRTVNIIYNFILFFSGLRRPWPVPHAEDGQRVVHEMAER